MVWNMCVHHILDDVDEDEDMVYEDTHVHSQITNNETRVDCEHVSNTPVTVF